MKPKTQKSFRTPTGEWMYCTVRVHPEEVAKWRAMAAVDDRTLSYWVRTELNKAAAALSEKGDSHEPEKALETVSADRPGSDAGGR